MKYSHGFFIIDEENCVDKCGLLKQLAIKIEINMECLTCQYYTH